MRALLETFTAHGTRVSTVTTVNPQDVSLDVAVSGEELQTNPAGVLVTDIYARQFRIVVVFLILVSLQHHSTLDGLVAMSAGVRCVLKI